MLKVLYKHKKLLVYTPLVIHWVSIFVLTSLPSDSLPHFALYDKFKHFIAYLVLSILLTLSFRVQSRFRHAKKDFVKYSFLITIAYSTFDEIHQFFIPGRDAEILDWIANLLGIILGIFLVKRIITKYEVRDFKEMGTETK